MAVKRMASSALEHLLGGQCSAVAVV